MGGSWVAWGNGRVPVGVDLSQTEFNSVEKIAGSKNVALTEANNGPHKHFITNELRHSKTSSWWIGGSGGTTIEVDNVATETSGTGEPHNNLQPYITCFMWKRIG